MPVKQISLTTHSFQFRAGMEGGNWAGGLTESRLLPSRVGSATRGGDRKSPDARMGFPPSQTWRSKFNTDFLREATVLWNYGIQL